MCCPYSGTGKDYTQEIYTADTSSRASSSG